MTVLVARTEELAALDGHLTRALTGPRPIVVSIEGPCGIGKSALLAAFLQHAKQRTGIAYVHARRLERLGTASLEERIHGGAQVAAIDDAQWSNYATNELLRAALADGRLRMAVLAYDDTAPRLRTPIDHRIALATLDDDEIERIVHRREPAFSKTHLHAIAANAAGSPYEAVTLARLGIDEPSAGRAIARFLSTLPAPARTIAQLIALVGAPMDDEFLRFLWSERRELESALELLAPLLVRGGNTVEFDHALTQAAIAETIPMKIPLHRRIVGALERRGVRSIGDQMLLTEQLLGSGDRERAMAAAIDLAFEAGAAGAPYAQLWASARHIELGEPPAERFVAFYSHYLEALASQGEYERAETIASHALSEAQRRQLPGIVTLAAQLIRAQWAVERHDAARASYDRYVEAFTDADERELLRAAAPWLRAS
jgi:hypothetical protein